MKTSNSTFSTKRSSYMNSRIKWFIYENYLVLTLFAFVAIALLIPSLLANDAGWAFVVTAVGSLLSFIHFIQKQHLDEAKFVNELFVCFNKRYDDLNGKLNAIVKKGEVPEFSNDEEGTLYDYFNLCSEEYLFYCRGYVYPEVWRAWEAGMKSFHASNKGLRDLWNKELEGNSYYGFILGEQIDAKNIGGKLSLNDCAVKQG